MKHVDFFPNIALDDFKLRNFPKSLAIKDYTHAEQSFIQILAKSQDVVSIFKVGEISTPGFSDLDFIVVLKNKPENLKQFEVLTRQAVEKNKEVIIHFPHVLHEKLFYSLPYLFPFYSLSRVYGKELTTVKLTKEQRRLLDIIILHDYIDIHWPQEFLRLFLDRKIMERGGFHSYVINDIARVFNITSKRGKLDLPVRVTFCRLNSLKYPLKMLEGITGKKYPESQSFVYEITSLRNAWLKMPDNKEKYKLLIVLLKKSLSFSLWIIKEFDMVLATLMKFEHPNWFFVEKDRTTLYVDDWDETAIGKAIALHKKTAEVVSVLPKNYLFQKKLLFNVLRGKAGGVSAQVNRDYLALLMQRAKLFKEQTDYLNAHQLSFKPIMRYDVLKPNKKQVMYKKMSMRIRKNRFKKTI
jgi:hypothetical protein